MKRIFVFYIILVYSLAVSSQSVQVSAPSHVSTGENFRVEYHVSSDNVSDVRLGKVPDGLEEIAGPYVSTQSSYQIVNGHATSNSSARVTYLFYAAKPGTYTIPGAVINVNGKTVSAKSHKVTVSGTAPHNSQQPQSAPRMHQQPQQEDHVAAQASGNDSQSVFIRVTANKNTVVEQEPVTLTYKLYTATQITVPSDLKMPNVQDFTIYEIPQPSSVQWQNESVNGRTYKCVTWKQYVVYPQSTGKLTVPGSSVQINKIVRNTGVDPLEQFLNPGSSYQEIETSVAVPALTVEVVPLPNRPANFSGGVGSFSMNTTISKNCVKAGEPITIQVNLSGTGNMKLVKHPIVSFPKDFEVYDPKVTDNTTNTKQGIQGSVTYDFIAVPQNKGHFTIPPVEFIYYDAATSGYKTLKSQEMKVDVLEGNGNTASESYQEELRNSDIYPIILLQNADYRSDDSFFMSTAYLLVIFSLLI
ncbi:MAG: protein BatD, partial [Bacteroidaceae bacterium]|nr:protein BatD [Bacteroidaceae bacterium]